MNPDHFVRPGQRLGKYILGEPIARGGMAEVWAARVEGPQGFVKSLALKFILESFTGDSDLERLFVNEARLAAQLQHANLVGVYDFDKMADADGRGTGRYYIAMERVDGHDLRRLLQNLYKRGRLLPSELALHIAGEVLKGLRYVHERRERDTQKPLGLVHRDVSPHNILIGMGGEVKLSDFGIAKAMTQSLGTQAGMIRGKLAYASPEQLRSDPLDHRTDQFALGVTLWEALAGRRLFEGGAEMEIIGKVLRCQVPLLPLDVGVAPPTEAIVRRMLAANAADRFGSTAEALSAVLAAPGYTPDGAPLEALMREVFAPQNLELPPTLPLDAQRPGAAPARGRGQTETSALARGAAAGVAFLDPLTAAPGSVGHTWVARPSGDGVPVARPVEGRPPDSSTFPEKERSVTGSAYVSTGDELPLIPRARPVVRAVSLVGALALGGAAIVIAARHPWGNAPGVPGAQPETSASVFRPGAAPFLPSKPAPPLALVPHVSLPAPRDIIVLPPLAPEADGARKAESRQAEQGETGAKIDPNNPDHKSARSSEELVTRAAEKPSRRAAHVTRPSLPPSSPVDVVPPVPRNAEQPVPPRPPSLSGDETTNGAPVLP